MSTQTVTMAADHSAGDVVIPDGVAEQLLAAAKTQGVSPTGPGGRATAKSCNHDLSSKFAVS